MFITLAKLKLISVKCCTQTRKTSFIASVTTDLSKKPRRFFVNNGPRSVNSSLCHLMLCHFINCRHVIPFCHPAS